MPEKTVIHTPESCFDEVKPLLEDVCNHLDKAPLSMQQRAGLALLVASHFVGNAHGAMVVTGLGFDKPGDVCDLIKDIIANPKSKH